MSSFNQRVVFSVLLCACSLTSSVFAAKKGGISDQSTRVVATSKAQQIGKGLSTIGNIADSSDAGDTTTSDTSTGSEVSSATRNCSFSGFAQNDLVNSAYAGGTSSNGVSQINNGITFTSAKILNTYYGSGEPNAGIVFSPSGRIVAGLVNFSANQISFAYTSSVVLTVSEFSSTDGTGTPINSYSAAATMPYGPYTVWTTFTTALSANAKSIAISGTTDKWGIDQVVVLSGSSELMVPSQYPTIQAAVNAAVNGNKVIVAPGVYPESVNLNGKQIRVESSTPRAAIVRAPENTRSFIMTTGETTETQIIGFRLEKSGTVGGGVSTSSSSPNLKDCLFIECTNATGGGALIQGGSPIFESCEFTSCNADGKHDSSTYGSGGAIRSIGGSVKINNCSFRNCVGPYNANILMLENGGSSLISHCTFSGNNTNSTSNIYNAYSTVTITDSVFESFSAGTVLFGWAPFTVERCQFKNITGGNVMVMRFGQNILRDCSFEDCITSSYLFGVTYSGTYALQNCNFCRVSTPYFQGAWSDLGGNNFNVCPSPATLTLTNDAGACNHAGGSVNVDATLSGVLSPIVSGQIYISWNPANMTLNSITAGDAPFNELPLNTINQAAGTALLVTSIPLGQPPVSVISKVVARMHFTVLGGTCDGSGTDVQFFPDGTLPTEFTDGFGSKLLPALVASSGFKVDDTSPVFSNVPAAVSVNADAGEGAFARVALIAPTATDACGAVTQASSRSDGAAMNAMYAVGTTTVTWSATDLCGNTSTATTSVTVKPYNTARFQVQYLGVNGGAATRSFVTTMRGPQISLPSTVNGVSIANGAGEFFVTNAPIDNYFCATIEDAASTLRRRVSVTDAGTEWLVVVTLVSGDVINDEVVDVLDWGAYVVRNANADLNMDNSTNASDGDMILANFGQKGDTGCGSNFTDSPEPVTSISIAELVDRGMADLVAADLNNDGWLDMADIELSLR